MESKLTARARVQGRAERSWIKFAIGGTLIVLVAVWLVYSNIRESSTYYLTVAELTSQGPSTRPVRATGLVVGNSIDWDAENMLLRFEIADEGHTLPVRYRGPRPDMLLDGTQAVVEGKYTATGSFEATSVLLKCPSKYEEK